MIVPLQKRISWEIINLGRPMICYVRESFCIRRLCRGMLRPERPLLRIINVVNPQLSQWTKTPLSGLKTFDLWPKLLWKTSAKEMMIFWWNRVLNKNFLCLCFNQAAGSRPDVGDVLVSLFVIISCCWTSWQQLKVFFLCAPFIPQYETVLKS